MPRRKVTRPVTDGLNFIVATDLSKADTTTRKLIRSHVMIGKNAGRNLPPRKKKIQKVESDSSPEADHVDASLALSSASRRFGTRTSTLAPADPVDSADINCILQISFVAKQMLFALEPCIFFERRYEEWLGPLTFDPAYLHCFIFTSHYALCAGAMGVRAGQILNNRQSMSHLVKSLKLLGDRIKDDSSNEKLSNSTAATIMALCGHALMTGDFIFAKEHIGGLARIIELRGGLPSFFGGSEKLLVEILRSDLGYALSQGATPMFLPLVFQADLYALPNLANLLQPHGLKHAHTLPLDIANKDPQLAEVWILLEDFTTLINFAAVSGQKITTALFMHVMTCVMYRLLPMAFPLDSQNELVRIGLLAFSCSAFMQWRRIGMSYVALQKTFRRALTCSSWHLMPSGLRLWTITMGGLAVLTDVDDEWLGELFSIAALDYGISDWDAMRSVMHGYLWIPLIHDEVGMDICAKYLAMH